MVAIVSGARLGLEFGSLAALGAAARPGRPCRAATGSSIGTTVDYQGVSAETRATRRAPFPA